MIEPKLKMKNVDMVIYRNWKWLKEIVEIIDWENDMKKEFVKCLIKVNLLNSVRHLSNTP